MSGLIKAVVYAGVTMMAGMIAPQAGAATYSGVTYWNTSAGPGAVAATCSITLPDEQPLTVPRTLIVGNDVPNGIEILSWGYGEWSSDVVLSCVGSGISNYSTAIAGFEPRVDFQMVNASSGPGVALNNPGLRLNIWIRPDIGSTPCNTSGCSINENNYTLYSQVSGTTSFINAGEDRSLNGYANSVSYLYQMINAPSVAGKGRLYPTITGRYSIRVSIVKVGNVSYGPLSVSGVLPGFAVNGTTWVRSLFQGSGITIVPPACKLKTTDYTISMGRWAADSITYVSTPVYGSQVPVNLSLECSGRVNHVRFRFEDTGSSLSSNRNISLYDTSGNKINGLEIELRYNGVKVNVDNSTLTDTGNHGTTKTSPASLPLYDSVSTATFYARYVQNAAITRSGINYIGPVTGKVNMYVTYD
ncbi:fimbrial protein [Klebsiella michiganensis]|uniref:fimbrial protein n=1 Tax=Klebsiella michiganensis TaxID=1134687 RepID=UPI0011E60CD2|nr:fimbrial protein [Klebsiella michiganensis]TXV06780.1 hypothetical protein D4M92_08220 [Klebsiella michiganensis]HDS8142569.1 fimbrial protein [Klebsiella michiganensis]HDT1976679.1 fimbrial protein [Klebsiella michiganensis]HDV9731486.1 fimbrial protein [Klebsiella michiganensis]HDV9800621.1 fimbrial protein [Klebsiella michiganensis]